MLLALPMRTMDVGRIDEKGNALAHKNRVIDFNKAIVGIECSVCLPRKALNSNLN